VRSSFAAEVVSSKDQRLWSSEVCFVKLLYQLSQDTIDSVRWPALGIDTLIFVSTEKIKNQLSCILNEVEDKRCTKYTCLALNEALNNLAYRTFVYVIIYRCYKVSKLVIFLAVLVHNVLHLCARYGMRYMAKTMRAALSAHYPNAAEKDILKVCLTSLCDWS